MSHITRYYIFLSCLVCIALVFVSMAEDKQILRTSISGVDSSDSGKITHPQKKVAAINRDVSELLDTMSLDSGVQFFPVDSSLIQDSSALTTFDIDSTEENSLKKTLLDSTAITEEEVDTSYRVWNQPFWSVGIGWCLGSMPVFDEWRGALPTNKIPQLISGIPDTLDSIKINDDPGTYNVNFPITIAYSPYVDSTNRLSFKLGFSWMYKKFEATAFTSIDTSVSDSFNIEQSMSLTNFSLGLFYSRTISKNYFIIEKAEKVTFTIGVSGSLPIVLKYKKSIGYDNADFSYTPVNIMSSGSGVSWYLGLSVFRLLSSKNALEIGALYKGSWNQRFCVDYDNNNQVSWSDINSGTRKTSVLKFISHRFVLYFDILPRRKQKSNDKDEVNHNVIKNTQASHK